MKLSFKLLDKLVILSAQSFNIPKDWTSGITSRIPGTNLHILLMDYDMIREDFLLEELEWLQEIFKIGNFYVFCTRVEKTSKEFEQEGYKIESSPIGGYHSICLDIDFLRNNLAVLRSSSSDYSFINAPSYNPEKHWVLRAETKGIRDKPVYVTTVKSPYEGLNGKLQSTFHARLIDAYYNLGIEPTLLNPDGSEIGIVDHYVTARRVR